MDPLQQAAKADHKTTLLVSGYIRSIQHMFGLDIHPAVIGSLCVGFYFNPEYFAKVRTDWFQLSDDKMTVTCINGNNFEHTIYCNQWIDSMLDIRVKWLLQWSMPDNVSIDPYETSVYIGLASEEGRCDESWPKATKAPNYALSNVDQVRINGPFYGTPFEHEWKLKNGDLIACVLDLTAKKFVIFVRDEQQRQLDIETGSGIQYKLAAQLVMRGEALTLVDFQIDQR